MTPVPQQQERIGLVPRLKQEMTGNMHHRVMFEQCLAHCVFGEFIVQLDFPSQIRPLTYFLLDDAREFLGHSWQRGAPSYALVTPNPAACHRWSGRSFSRALLAGVNR